MIDGDMEKLREIFTLVCFAMGIAALILCIHQAWKTGSTATLGAAFIVCALFVFLSQIKTFKVWEVQVELREQLDQAQALLQQLRRTSINSARAAYNQAAWGNRMGAPTAREKQAQLDEVDKQLADLNISAEERAGIVRPMVRIIGFDLYQVFSRTLQAYAALRYSALVERARSGEPKFVEEREQHSIGVSQWSKREAGQNPFERLYRYDLATELERETPRAGEWLNAQELESARAFAKEITALYSGCSLKGHYTAEAAAYLDDYGRGGTEGYERKARQVFGRALEDLKH
ncbi:hypothetical protein [Bradyrhizobium sp. BR 1432]|uniref:hypothetical protein n=1 Tax=Bradyrhizobium sp. BR 1432 TaxID=3447966 RepID=UPI003EE6E620